MKIHDAQGREVFPGQAPSLLAVPSIPRSRSSPALAVIKRMRAARKALLLVADGMRHIGHVGHAEQAAGAADILTQWIDELHAQWRSDIMDSMMGGDA